MSLYKIQQELKVSKAKNNSFGGYNYRTCSDILEAVKPILAKYEYVCICTDEVVECGGKVYIKATAIIGKCDNTIRHEATAYAREPESKKKFDDGQLTGMSSSYARKYALSGLLAIDDTKDADATNTHGKEQKQFASKAETSSSVDDNYRTSVIHTIGKLCKQINKYPVTKELTKDQKEMCQATLFSVCGKKSVVNVEDIKVLEDIQAKLEELKGDK